MEDGRKQIHVTNIFHLEALEDFYIDEDVVIFLLMVFSC